jgi:hypothetical protein
MSVSSQHPILSAAALGLVLTLAAPSAETRANTPLRWLSTLTHELIQWVESGEERRPAPAARRPSRALDSSGPGVTCIAEKDPNGSCSPIVL